MSIETIRRFLADVLRLPISHGQVVKTVQKASAALRPCYEQLQSVLPQQSYMGIDETGHRRQQMPEERWQRAAANARQELLTVARRVPTRSEAQNIAKRFRDHADACFTFLDRPGIEPTNPSPPSCLYLRDRVPCSSLEGCRASGPLVEPDYRRENQRDNRNMPNRVLTSGRTVGRSVSERRPNGKYGLKERKPTDGRMMQ